MNNVVPAHKNGIKTIWLLPALWLLTFAIYIATTRAGWVIDGVGFLYNMKHLGFRDFINRTNSTDQSFYQVLTLHYYVFYKIWGLNPFMWGILYITVHAINAYLVFLFSRNILRDSGVAKTTTIALCGVALFTVSPHISEILVCRAYYHYLQCFLFMLLAMRWVQKYQHQQGAKYVVGSAAMFIFSVFTLEVFYLLPVLILIIALYYRFALNYERAAFRKTVLYFFLPQVLLMGVYFLSLFLVFKHITPHKIEINETIVDYLAKLPKYIFHIVFLGRFFSPGVKKEVYSILESVFTLIAFYTLLTYVFVYTLSRFRQISIYGKAMFFFFVLAIANICFLMPLPFPGPELLVFYDRYIYFAAAFVYIIMAMLVARYIKNKYLVIGLFCVYVDLNLYFTIALNTYWIDSDRINTKLLRDLPAAGEKTVLLLNLPENMNGAPMIGAQPDGMYKHMREIYTGTTDKNTIYDVASYNMVTDYNGAHVTVVNDSVINVQLNHTGTWWWYEGHGAKDYETPDYKVTMKKLLVYELVLKHPAEKYLLLYSVGDKWKTVDMGLKNKQQD